MKLQRSIGLFAALACAAVVVAVPTAVRAEPLRPYVLASEGPGSVAETVAQAAAALSQEGFEVVGEYPVSENAHVVVVSSPALRDAAAKTADGGYGAVVRVSVTKVGDAIQVAYTNPAWMANICRLAAEPEGVAAALEKALGRREEFGSKSGIAPKELRSYHYMVFMPYFNDQVVLGAFASRDEAAQKLEAGLAAGGEARKIYRVDVDADQSLFGVAILAGEGADAKVMGITDTAPRRHTAHLPYEVLVSKGRVLMLHGKFRIAQSFPDLTMGTFMKISGAPDGIEKVLRSLVK